jgi:hypothetical protein
MVLDVGKPAASGSVYAAEIEVPDASAVWVVVSAYDASQESPYSNETLREPPAAGGGSGGGSGGGGSSGGSGGGGSGGGGTGGGSGGGGTGGRLLWENFDGYAPGADPAGWVDTGTGRSRADDALFRVEGFGSQRIFVTRSEEEVYSHYVTPESESWTAYEFSGRMRITDPGGAIGVTVLSQLPGREAHYRVSREAGKQRGVFHASPQPKPKRLACHPRRTHLVPLPDQWYAFRLQAAAEGDRTTVRAKVWQQGSDEPAEWQVDCRDASRQRLVRGVPGLWAAGPGAKFWDGLAVVPLEAARALRESAASSDPARRRPPAPPVLHLDR